MINLNGTLQANDKASVSFENRGLKYGDALFETLKVVHSKILFWEDHYFRLMASMRILRMEIPMNFTMEFLESEILKVVEANMLSHGTARIRVDVHRQEGGKYLPNTKLIAYAISAEKLDSDFYAFNESSYVIDLFKDYFMAPGLLSTLKTNNRIMNVLGSIYASENNFDNCLLLNTNKNLVEGLNGNLFIVKDGFIKTPPLEDGCIKGIMRKQMIEIINNLEGYQLEEVSISPFELQKADELFLTNTIVGIQPITSYRKKRYTQKVSKILVDKLNIKVRLG